MVVAVDLFFKLVQSTALDETATKRVEVKLMLAIRQEKIPYAHDLQFMVLNHRVQTAANNQEKGSSEKIRCASG